MSYSKKNIVTSIALMIFIISFAVVVTVFFKELYYLDIHYLGIDLTSGLSTKVIKENYDILINYQSIFYQGSLQFNDFIMSEGGRIHFEEVKKIFELIQILMVVSGITSLVLVINQIKNKEYRFFKLTGIITLVVPLIIGALASIDFNRAFVLFHEIVFDNDYWIFNNRTDPIINILPESFFMHCFIMIVVIVIILNVACILYYNHLQKKIVNEIEANQ